jgi:hypothetical protein
MLVARAQKADRLINELTEYLSGSVPIQDYVDVLNALRRCKDFMENSIITIEEYVSRDCELAQEGRLYLSILNGFFDEVATYPSTFVHVGEDFDPREYLKSKGVIKE